MSLDEYRRLPAREAEEYIVYIQLIQQQEKAKSVANNHVQGRQPNGR
jgi:hypothetical protein